MMTEEEKVILRTIRECASSQVVTHIQRSASMHPHKRVALAIIAQAFSDMTILNLSDKETAGGYVMHDSRLCNRHELRQFFGKRGLYPLLASAVGLEVPGKVMLEESRKRANETEEKILRELEKLRQKESEEEA